MYQRLDIKTDGENFYNITEQVNHHLQEMLGEERSTGVLFIFCQHTSCALAITEGYDPSAKHDVEEAFKHLFPRNLPFVTHRSEGDDDSPSHMKSVLLHQHIAIPVEKRKMFLGPWQGIFLAEFRDAPHNRHILMKFMEG